MKAMPEDNSETVSQILFGEVFEIVGKSKKWLKVKLAWDDYHGWIDEKQITPVDEKYYRNISDQPPPLAAEIVHPVTASS